MDLAYIILDSSSVFSSGSFDIIRDSRRWLIIAGQENKAFAAQSSYFLRRRVVPIYTNRNLFLQTGSPKNAGIILF
jgi:hypothetical protein